MTQPQATTMRPAPPRRHVARGGSLAALLLVAALLGGCSKDDGGEAATTTSAEGELPSDGRAQQKAMEAAERVLSTVRLPGASGFYAKTTKACPSGELPQASRPDVSTLDPDEVVSELTDTLADQDWTHENVGEGQERYAKDSYVISVEVTAAEDGGTDANVSVTAAQAACG